MNDKLLYLIKTQGWRVTSNMVGGPDVLFKLLDITPMKFLQSFNHLEQYAPSADITSYGHPDYSSQGVWSILLHDKVDNICLINYEEIWSLLEFGFKLSYKETQDITKQWVYDVYNISVNRASYFRRN